MNLGLEGLGVTKTFDYKAKVVLSIYGKSVQTDIRIVTDNGIISAEQFKLYSKVMSGLTKYIDQIITDDKSKIDYVSVEILGKAPKGDHFAIGVGLAGNEHIHDGEFVNDKLVYNSLQG